MEGTKNLETIHAEQLWCQVRRLTDAVENMESRLRNIEAGQARLEATMNRFWEQIFPELIAPERGKTFSSQEYQAVSSAA